MRRGSMVVLNQPALASLSAAEPSTIMEDYTARSMPSSPSTSSSNLDATVRLNLSVDDPAYSLLQRLDVITTAFFGLLDNVEIVRMGAPPIAASDVQVAVQALRGSSSVTATIRTTSDVAAELARRSFEAQLPDKSQARARLGLIVRETPSCTISITRLHVAEVASVTPIGVALPAHRLVGRESDDDQISFIEYLDQHEGFIVALGLVVFVPLLLIVVCCL